MGEAVCKICKVRFERPGNQKTCPECHDRLIAWAVRTGKSRDVSKYINLVCEGGWGVLRGIDENGTHDEEEKKVETVPIKGDALLTYVHMVQEWRLKAGKAPEEKEHLEYLNTEAKKALDYQCVEAKKKVDDNVRKAKLYLDSFTRDNASVLKPLLQQLALPIVDEEKRQKAMESERMKSEEANARKKETLKDMVDST